MKTDIRIKITVAIIGIFSILFISQFWKDDERTNISYNHYLSSDGGGYYNYLPSIFIRNDFGADTSGKGSTFITQQGYTINKYYVGTALLDLPFFALGCLDTKLHHQTITGYNYWLQIDAALGSLFFFLLGCVFALKWLQVKFNSVTKAIIALLITIFGTSIIYFYTYEPFYSHCYTFCILSMYMYYVHFFYATKKYKYLLFSALTMGLLVIIRPTNALVILLLPFLAENTVNFKSTSTYILENKKRFLVACLAALAIIAIQPFMNFWQCGNFFEWSYKREGFIFSDPQFYTFLVGFECGLFIYVPISILAFLGLIKLIRIDKYQGITLALFLIVVVYVLSSWWCITYGDSMPTRPLTDYTTIFAFLIGTYIFNVKTKIVKYLAYLFVVFALLYNLKIFYQYSHGVLHFGMMNKEKYIFTFNKFSENYFGCLGGNKVQGIYSSKEPKLILETKNSFDSNVPYYNTTNAVKDPENKLNNCLYFNDNEFNNGFELENDSMLFNSTALYAELEISRKETSLNSASDALMVMHLTYPNSTKQIYYTFRINELPKDLFSVWHKWYYTIDIPKPLYPNYKLSFYIWNIKKQKFYIDDFSLKIYRLY